MLLIILVYFAILASFILGYLMGKKDEKMKILKIPPLELSGGRTYKIFKADKDYKVGDIVK